MGGKPIKPVQLPKHEMKLEDNTKCTVAGWGPTEKDGEIVSDLREAEVPIVNMKECERAWDNSLPANVICAGGHGTKRGVCGVCFLFCQPVCELKSQGLNILNNK